MRAMRIGCAAVLGALLVAIGGCGSDDTEAVTESETATATETQATETTAATVEHLNLFSTPSKNIACAMEAEFVRCDIAKKDWTPPPKPKTCELDWGNGLNVEDGTPGAPVCAGDTVLGDHPTLDYGSASEVGSFRCESETAGVTCTNVGTGNGFFLSKQSFRLF